MTATAHALVSGAIASKFADPASASVLSLLSHYIMDSIPHWDFGTNWRLRPKSVTGTLAIGETLLGIGLAFWLFSKSASVVTLGVSIFASLLPDWIETPWYIFFANAKKKAPSSRAGFLEKVSYRIYKIQNGLHSKAQLPFGLITQIITVGFFLFLLK